MSLGLPTPTDVSPRRAAVPSFSVSPATRFGVPVISCASCLLSLILSGLLCLRQPGTVLLSSSECNHDATCRLSQGKVLQAKNIADEFTVQRGGSLLLE